MNFLERTSLPASLRLTWAALSLLTLLSACGGGGGSSDSSGTNNDQATVATLVPAAGMTWATAAVPALTVSVTGTDGAPAAGAAVRIFTLSRTSPQDGSALLEPVPVNLLETIVSDSNGQARLPLRLPADQTEVLVVATLADAKASGTLGIQGSAPGLALTLVR